MILPQSGESYNYSPVLMFKNTLRDVLQKINSETDFFV